MLNYFINLRCLNIKFNSFRCYPDRSIHDPPWMILAVKRIVKKKLSVNGDTILVIALMPFLKNIAVKLFKGRRENWRKISTKGRLMLILRQKLKPELMCMWGR